MLDLYRNDVRRQGLAVPCAHNKGDTRVFVGTAFEDEAVKFFGSPPDGADAEAYLQERYRILKSQEKVVNYVNSCDGRENDPRKKWNYKTRAGELGDFNELALEFKAACPTYVDEETGALKYAEPGFVDAFVDCIRRRNPELKCKTHIQKLCKKRRLLRNCNLTDAEKEALYHADYEVVVRAVAAAAARARVVQDADGNYPCAQCGRVFDHAPAAIAHSKVCNAEPTEPTEPAAPDAEPDAEPDAAPTAPTAPDATREEESPPPLVEPAPDATDEEEDSPSLPDHAEQPAAPDASLGEEASPPPADHTEAPAPAPAPRGPKRKSASGGTSSRPTKKPRIGYDELIKTGAGVGGLLIAFALGFNGTSGA